VRRSVASRSCFDCNGAPDRRTRTRWRELVVARGGVALFSLVVPLPPKFAQPDRSGQLSLAVAEAVAGYLKEVLQPSGHDQVVRVKRPNDVYVADAKIAGLLIDVPHQRNRKRRLAVLGIGLNVNNDGSNCPLPCL